MTVKTLNKFISTIGVPVVGRPKKSNDTIPFYLNQLKGKTIAIDTSLIIYAMNYRAAEDIVASHNFQMVDGRWDHPDPSLIYPRFVYHMREYIHCIRMTGITPIYVMDGDTPPMKKALHEKRNREKESHRQQYDSVLAEHRRKVIYYYYPDDKHSELTVSLLQDEGYKVLRAQYEAEGVCAYLAINKYCHGILSDDSDAIMYGCPIILRRPRMLNSLTGHMEIEGIAIIDILLSMEFLTIPYTPDQYDAAVKRLRLFCILCGTDYYPGVHQMAATRVYKLMMAHNIHTYEEMCAIDERFKEVPYYDILKTLEENTKYTILSRE